MATLKLNDRGFEVIKLQLLLNFYLRPCPFLLPMGHFDRRTFNAVVVFQKEKKLIPDGEVGVNTHDALGLTDAPLNAIPLRPATPWIDIAYAENGVVGILTPGQHTARIIEYHRTTTLRATDDETPWCSSFVNWVMQQSGRTGTKSALAKSWLDWGASAKNPARGDIAIIRRKSSGYTRATGSSTGYHVGFYISSTPTHIKIFGGNQSNQVKESNFPLKSYDVMGYRRPK